MVTVTRILNDIIYVCDHNNQLIELRKTDLNLHLTDTFEGFHWTYALSLPFLIVNTPQGIETQLWVFLWVSLSRSLVIWPNTK